MGNCLKSNNQISAQDEEYNEQPSEAAVAEQVKKSSSFKLEPDQLMPEESMKVKKKKKMVRFKLQNDDHGGGKRSCSTNSRSGPVRIRLMVTREELQRILRYENDIDNTSLEQLLCAMELGRSRISEVREDDDGAINAWRPTLESIPEDRSMK